jgi:hypothetical protein
MGGPRSLWARGSAGRVDGRVPPMNTIALAAVCAKAVSYRESRDDTESGGPIAPTVMPAGGPIIEEKFTVRVADRLVTLPPAFETVTANRLPLSSAVAGGVLYFANTAPGISVPFFVHW